MPQPLFSRIAFLAVLVTAGLPAAAAETRVAVAANFTAAAKSIGKAFTTASGHKPRFSFGSTGQLYAQISQGAPFDIFLAADVQRPQMAIQQGHGVTGTAFTYAIGTLALYSRDAKIVVGPQTLTHAAFSRLAMANPATAPYGAAAMDVLDTLVLSKALASKIVRGNNIAQAFQFVETGNAELGFVALAQINGRPGGSRWIVPAAMHRPIAQAAVLLQRGADNPAARAFLEFLKSGEGRAIIARLGYRAGQDD